MAHGIVKNVDRGVVGFIAEFGKTWHGLKEYAQQDGEVTKEQVREALGYEVQKVSLGLKLQEYQLAKMPAGTHDKITDMFALVRCDSGTVLHNISVSQEYQIYQNAEFLDEVESGILKDHPELAIESCGSLFGGRKAFVSLLLNRFRVKKDSSETLSRLMYTNAFGGIAISCGLSTVRVVCNNTHYMATAQSLANGTLRKHKHTKGAPQKVKDNLIDIMALNEETRKHKEALDFMVDKQMDKRDVDVFLGNIFPVSKDDSEDVVTGKAFARRTNKQEEIRSVFETAPDLQGDIAGTRYAMFQAVTNFNSHGTTKENDTAFVWDNILSGGNRHKVNQYAFDILTDDEITPRKGKLMLA